MAEDADDNSGVNEMEDEKDKEVKVKKWEHLAVRPETFEEARELKEELKCKSDNEFIQKLIKEFKNARE